MSKRTIKIVSILLIALMAVTMLGTSVLALSPSDLTGTDPEGTDIKDFGNEIIGILQTVGIVLSVVILVILGIKYMMGSAEEKAEYKKTMIPYIVGAVLIFAAPTIANIVYNFVKPN